MLVTDIRPEIGQKVVVIDFEGKGFLALFELVCQFLLLFVLSKLNLTQIFMLKFLLIRVVDFFFNFLLSKIFLFIFLLIPIIVLNHHDTLLLIMPGSLRLFLVDLVRFPDEEGFRQSAIDHHDIAFYGEEARIIAFL